MTNYLYQVYSHSSLGASHDGSNNNCDGNDQYVMAAVSGQTDEQTRGHPWYFSSCSISYFMSFIDSLDK